MFVRAALLRRRVMQLLRFWERGGSRRELAAGRFGQCFDLGDRLRRTKLVAVSLALAAYSLYCWRDALILPGFQGNSFVTRPRIDQQLPHDPECFCQGLLSFRGTFYESAGLYGQSTLREVDPFTGKVIRQTFLPSTKFAEGIVPIGDKILQLTWRERTGYIWNAETLRKVDEVQFTTTTGEGWGATTDGSFIIVSDGSNYLHFWHPTTLRQIRRIPVYIDAAHAHLVVPSRVQMRASGAKLIPVSFINELQYFNGELLANVWGLTTLLVLIRARGL